MNDMIDPAVEEDEDETLIKLRTNQENSTIIWSKSVLTASQEVDVPYSQTSDSRYRPVTF